MRAHRLCVVGGINMDLHLQSTFGAMQRGTSNPSHGWVSPGGVARNVAENLARWGCEVTLLGAVGEDALSESVLRATAASGVVVARVLRMPDATCGLYTALLDADGELAIAASAMDVTEAVTPEYIRRAAGEIAASELVVVDANIPAHAIAEVVKVAEDAGVPVVAEPVSVAKARRLASVEGRVLAVTPNEDEASVFGADSCRLRTGWTVVTRGAAGVDLVGVDGRVHLEARPVTAIDVTGAGDALVAGLVYGIVSEAQLAASARLGIEVAARTVASAESVCSDLTAAELEAMLRVAIDEA
ncbi:MAG: carbohydrate kinase family protein [Spirochaetota bacterium]